MGSVTVSQQWFVIFVFLSLSSAIHQFNAFQMWPKLICAPTSLLFSIRFSLAHAISIGKCKSIHFAWISIFGSEKPKRNDDCVNMLPNRKRAHTHTHTPFKESHQHSRVHYEITFNFSESILENLCPSYTEFMSPNQRFAVALLNVCENVLPQIDHDSSAVMTSYYLRRAREVPTR